MPIRHHTCLGLILMLFIMTSVLLKIKRRGIKDINIVLSCYSKKILAITLLVMLVFTLSSFQSNYNEKKYNFYGEWYWLLGKKFRNNIYVLSINSLDQMDYHQYKNFSSNGMKDFRGNPDYNIWLQNLKKYQIKYIY